MEPEKQSTRRRPGGRSRGDPPVLHEEFADRVADRLEATAEELEGETGTGGNDAIRARVLRLAADVALQEAAVVTREESPPPIAQA